jgi:hypothetical protein
VSVELLEPIGHIPFEGTEVLDTEDHLCHQASKAAQRVEETLGDVQVQGKGLLIQVDDDL